MNPAGFGGVRLRRPRAARAIPCRMVALLWVGLVLGGTAAPLAADVGEEVERLIQAWGDRPPSTAQVRSTLESSGIDVWLLAEEARLVAGAGLAGVVADAADDVATVDALRAYLERAPTGGAVERLRSIVGRARPLCSSESWAAALEILPPLPPGEAIDTVTEVEALRLQATAYAGRGSLREAVEAGLRGAEGALSLGWTTAADAAFREQLGAAFAAGRIPEALRAARGLLQLQQLAGEVLAVAKTYKDLTGLSTLVGDFSAVEEHAMSAIAALESEGDPTGVVEMICLRALVRAEIGDTAGALEDHYRASDRLAGMAPDVVAAARCRLRLAQVLWRAGREDDGRQLLESARAVLAEHGDERDRAEVLGIQGLLSGLAGRHESAATTLQQSAEAFLAAGDILQSAVARLNQASQIRRHVEQVLLAPMRTDGSAGDAAHAAARTRAREALGLLEEPLALLSENGLGLYLTAGELTKAHLLRLAGDHQAALDLLGDCRGRASDLRLERRVVEVDCALAATHLAAGRHRDAILTAQQAVDGLGRLQAGLADVDRARAMYGVLDAHDLGCTAAAAAHDLRALLRFLEMGRAASALRGLGGARALARAFAPAELLAAHAAAVDEKIEKVAEVGATRRVRGGAAAIRSARTALAAAWEAERRIIEQLDLRQAEALRRVVSPPLATMDDVQRLVKVESARAGRTAMVWWNLQPGACHGLVVDPSGPRLVTYSAAQVAAIRGALSVLFRDTKGTLDAAAIATLRKSLVEPLGLPSDTRRLLVSPDRDLGYAPLGLLLPDNVCATIMPSASLHLLLDKTRAAPGQRVLGLGNPDYRELPFPMFGRGEGGARLSPLPDTALEISAIAVGARDVQLLGAQATEGRLRAALADLAPGERFRSVHLATHAEVNAEEPAFSWLALTPSAGDDGLLTALEAARLDLRTDLVVLSACDTARGPFLRGEGILGLSRAFMLAGAPRALASLWQVDSAATRSLMVEMYRRWRGGVPLDQALRQAQAFVRDLESEEFVVGADGKARKAKVRAWQDPKFWAGWSLWGLPD